MSASPQEMQDNPPVVDLDDNGAADWLKNRLNEKRTVVYAHAGYLCKLYCLDEAEPQLHQADPDASAQKALVALAKQHLLLHVQPEPHILVAARTAEPAWRPQHLTQTAIKELIAQRQRLLGRLRGRGDEIPKDVALKVWADAGARCMFEGCPEDLSHIPLYTKEARIGYLAHIVASDPGGPRGDPVLSHQLSKDRENVMLMCDAHHRLIDVFAPDAFSVTRLRAMREAHTTHVRRCLDALRYPQVRVATLFADLANLPTSFRESELNEAVLAIGRAMRPSGVVHYIRRTQRDDRRGLDFWTHYLHEHENDIRELVSSFRRRDTETAPKGEVAVFPLHHVATLMLAGRIIGEAQAVHVFQYHRERQTWMWEAGAAPQEDGFFSLSGLDDREAPEVLLTLELTATVDENALPDRLRAAVADGCLPWVRIRAREPSYACIRHPVDLDRFMGVARTAINRIQDVVRARQVHLIAISPASTVFCFGQMLQPGHHPTYSVYDRSDRESPFTIAFSVSGHDVSAGSGPDLFSISLR
jgi:hypothetical protein